MERLEGVLNMIEHALNTRRKRHIAGGILTSISLLFGSLAITVLTLKNDEKEEDNNARYLE